MQRWQQVARRIRVPLGFLTASVYLIEVARQPPHPTAIAWSLALVLPGLALRAAASGTVKKNQELTVTGPTHTRETHSISDQHSLPAASLPRSSVGL